MDESERKQVGKYDLHASSSVLWKTSVQDLAEHLVPPVLNPQAFPELSICELHSFAFAWSSDPVVSYESQDPV